MKLGLSWRTKPGLAGTGPQYRLTEFADRKGVGVHALLAMKRGDDTFPDPVTTSNHRGAPCGKQTCPLYRLADLEKWWAKRQQKKTA